MYVAERSGGAWLNSERIHVSSRQRLVDSVVSCGIPFAGKPDHPIFAREMALLSERTVGIRRTGPAGSTWPALPPGAGTLTGSAR